MASAQRELAYFAEVDFDDVKISVKASNVPLMIEAYRQLSRGHRPPAAPRRHRGRPAAGRAGQGHRRHRHPAGRGHRRHHPLLAHRRPGRGGPGRPPAARGAGPAGAQDASTSSPARRCGRAEIDVIRVAKEAEAALAERKLPIQVAVMGCVVNGPGEARIGRPRHRRRPRPGPPVRQGPDRAGRARGRDGGRPGRGGREAGGRGRRGPPGRGRRRARPRRPSRPPGPARRPGRRPQRQSSQRVELDPEDGRGGRDTS